MNIADIIGSNLLDGLKGIISSFVTDPTKKAELEAQATALAAQQKALIEQSFQKEIEAKEAIMVAELQQDDKFTKRSRPMIIYVGLGAMVLNNVLLPWLAFFTGSAHVPPPINIPDIFWEGWIGVCGLYVIGRTAEKTGVALPFMKPIDNSGSK